MRVGLRIVKPETVSWLHQELQRGELPRAALGRGLSEECSNVRTRQGLVRSGRRQRLLFGRGNYRLDWPLYAAGQLEPG